MARFITTRKKPKPTTRRVANKRRRGALAFVLPWLRRFGFTLAVFVFIAWVGAWLWLSGTVQRAGENTKLALIDKSADMGFSVENLLVEGRVHADASTVLSLMNIRKGDPLFSFKPKDAQEKLSNMQWVKSALVERRLPDTIYVSLTERTPLALWQKDGLVKLLDQAGDVISIQDIATFSELITVMGEGAPEHAPALMTLLSATPDIQNAVKSATRIGQRRWDLRLKNDVIVKLPEDNTGLATRRLAEAQSSDDILQRSIMAVDLREPEKLVIRTRPGAVQEYQEYKASFSADKKDTSI